MSDPALDESVDLKIIAEPMPEAMIEVGDEAKPTELENPPEELDLPAVPMPEATVEVEEKAKQQAEDVEAMINDGDEAKPNELKPSPVELDLPAVPMPETTVEVEENAIQQAEAVGDDIPVVANFETVSMDGIPPEIEVPEPTKLLLPPEKIDLPAVESVQLQTVPKPMPEAMINDGDEAKPTELENPSEELDLPAVPMPETTVEVEENAIQQAEAVGDDIPVVAKSETVSVDGIPPNIEVPGPTKLLPPEKLDLPAGMLYNTALKENEAKTFRELIDDILREPVSQLLIRMNQMHPTVVVRSIGITVDIGRLGVPGPSTAPLPASQIGLPKAQENVSTEGTQEISQEEPDNKPKVDENDTGMEKEKDADKDLKEKPEKEPEGESKPQN